jgi:hypothetical protein
MGRPRANSPLAMGLCVCPRIHSVMSGCLVQPGLGRFLLVPQGFSAVLGKLARWLYPLASRTHCNNNYNRMARTPCIPARLLVLGTDAPLFPAGRVGGNLEATSRDSATKGVPSQKAASEHVRRSCASKAGRTGSPML